MADKTNTTITIKTGEKEVSVLFPDGDRHHIAPYHEMTIPMTGVYAQVVELVGYDEADKPTAQAVPKEVDLSRPKKQEDIAKSLDIPIGTVRSRLNRGRRS